MRHNRTQMAYLTPDLAPNAPRLVEVAAGVPLSVPRAWGGVEAGDTTSGVSAKTLHRSLGPGSHQTVWAMLYRNRTAMI